MNSNSYVKAVNDAVKHSSKCGRYVDYFYDFTTSKGTRRAGVNVYDDVLKWITYVNDYKFTDEELKQW